MAGQTLARVFITYSRTDSIFVDRLEADLRARGYDTWVDRRRLEGGQEWARELERAIDLSDLVIVTLSPEAVQSTAVRDEYVYAQGHAKPIVPLLYREAHMPEALAPFQWVSFLGVTYEQGLRDLLDALTRLLDPASALPMDSRDLYRQALDVERSGDLERASLLLERLVRRDANYAGGEPARDLARVNDRLLPTRVQRLRVEAEDAHRADEYDREAGALEALCALAPNDAWAQEYLPIAQSNRRYLDLYAVIQHLVEVGAAAEAKEKLIRLWADAPYFRDPAGLASRLGLRVPPTYEEVKAQRAAEQARQTEARRRHEEELQAAAERKRQAETRVQYGTYAKATWMYSLISGIVFGALLVVISVPLVNSAATTSHNVSEHGTTPLIVLAIALIISIGLYLSSLIPTQLTRADGAGRAAAVIAGSITGLGLGIVAFVADAIVYASQYGGSPSSRMQDQSGVAVVVSCVLALGGALVGSWLGRRAEERSLRRALKEQQRHLAEIEAAYNREVAEITHRFGSS